MEKRYHDKFEAPTLEERKRKLSEIRGMKRSIELDEIAEHKKKLEKLKAEHEAVKIINDPMKLSYKSKLHN